MLPREIYLYVSVECGLCVFGTFIVQKGFITEKISSFLDMIRWMFVLLIISGNIITLFCMTRQQLKNTGKLMKKSCMPKNDVTEEQVGDIEKGKFIEERNVKCYIACVYTMTQVVKNNRLNYEAVLKQIDVMFPPDMKEAVRAAADHCKDIGKKFKDDLCEASYRTARCMYDFDPKNFVFA